MKANEKESVATRILLIIQAVLNGKDIAKLTLKDFDFNVSCRTFQRDIKKIKDFFITYQADNRGGGLTKNIQKFATLSGIKALYPSLDEYFLSELFDERSNFIYNVSLTPFAKTNPKLFDELSSAILYHQCLSFEYKNKPRLAKPYELSHIQGVWYLIAEEANTLKHFAFDKIINLKILKEHFKPQKHFLTQLKNNKALWISNKSQQALLSISPKAREYFLRKELPSNFHLIKDNEKEMLLRLSFAFEDELFKLVKTWLPYIRIQEPKHLQDKFEKILKEYLQTTNADITTS